MWLGVFLLNLDGMLVRRRVTPNGLFLRTYFYYWVKKVSFTDEEGKTSGNEGRVESCTMGVKLLAQEHNAVPRPGNEP